MTDWIEEVKARREALLRGHYFWDEIRPFIYEECGRLIAEVERLRADVFGHTPVVTHDACQHIYEAVETERDQLRLEVAQLRKELGR